MIRKALPFILIFLLFALQVFFHSLYGLVDALPDLIPIAIAVAAARWNPGGVAMLGFVAGVMEDSFSTSYLGLNSLAWTAAGTIGASIKSSLYGNRVAVAVILVAVLKAIHDVIFNVVYLWNSPGDLPARLFLEMPLAVVYSSGLGLIFFIILDRAVLE
jgi:rod shape-determining protein MreD